MDQIETSSENHKNDDFKGTEEPLSTPKKDESLDVVKPPGSDLNKAFSTTKALREIKRPPRSILKNTIDFNLNKDINTKSGLSSEKVNLHGDSSYLNIGLNHKSGVGTTKNNITNQPSSASSPKSDIENHVRPRSKKRKPESSQQENPTFFECAHCSRKYREKSHLASHLRAHIDIRNFKCPKCELQFKTSSNLHFHLKTHSDTPLVCNLCNKAYPERKMLKRHIRIVHSCTEKFTCDQCGKDFKTMNILALHYTLHTGAKPFSCQKCDKSFVYKSTYVAHMKGHEADNNFHCDLCPSEFANRRTCFHHSDARPWLCTVCGKGYPLKRTLKNHMKSHEPEKPFKCNECPKSFMKKLSLECHKKVHSGERPEYMCDQCSQSYFNVFALRRHYLKHISERKFICKVCEKAFWMKDALRVHMRSHSAIKMFPCSQCSKAFVHKHTLHAHMRSHNVEQSYACHMCNKTFLQKYLLSKHECIAVSAPSTPTQIPSSATLKTFHVL